MERPLLNDKEIYPDEKVLSDTLGEVKNLYDKLINTISKSDYNLTPEWRFYNDYKSWLCKVVYKKKTIFWLSIWDKCFKITFYFNDKNAPGLNNIDMSDELKEDFFRSTSTNKFKPLIFVIKSDKQFDDIYKVIRYKLSQK